MNDTRSSIQEDKDNLLLGLVLSGIVNNLSIPLITHTILKLYNNEFASGYNSDDQAMLEAKIRNIINAKFKYMYKHSSEFLKEVDLICGSVGPKTLIRVIKFIEDREHKINFCTKYFSDAKDAIFRSIDLMTYDNYCSMNSGSVDNVDSATTSVVYTAPADSVDTSRPPEAQPTSDNLAIGVSSLKVDDFIKSYQLLSDTVKSLKEEISKREQQEGKLRNEIDLLRNDNKSKDRENERLTDKMKSLESNLQSEVKRREVAEYNLNREAGRRRSIEDELSQNSMSRKAIEDDFRNKIQNSKKVEDELRDMVNKRDAIISEMQSKMSIVYKQIAGLMGVDIAGNSDDTNSSPPDDTAAAIEKPDNAMNTNAVSDSYPIGMPYKVGRDSLVIKV